MGDADDGRFLPLGDYGADPRSHMHLFRQAGVAYEPATGSAAYPAGGWYVLRDGETYAIVRCGDTGLYGRGGHSHNDQLSFELYAAGRPLVADPGSYVYTADPAARNLFRSTAFHSTLRVDGGEQNELRSDYLFSMADRTRAECLSFDGRVFEGRHHGFAAVVHTRRIELVGDGVVVTDRIDAEADAEHELEWTFTVAPGADGHVEVDGGELQFERVDGWHSPSYGVRQPAPFLRARRRTAAPVTTTIRIAAGAPH
jgi:hypothetical protein